MWVRNKALGIFTLCCNLIFYAAAFLPWIANKPIIPSIPAMAMSPHLERVGMERDGSNVNTKPSEQSGSDPIVVTSPAKGFSPLRPVVGELLDVPNNTPVKV